jgi:hypothetical protein
MLHKTSCIFVGIFDSSFSAMPAEYIIVFGIYVHCLSAWEPEQRSSYSLFSQALNKVVEFSRNIWGLLLDVTAGLEFQ